VTSPSMKQFDTIAILGIGLLGGSVGLAAKKRGLTRRVIGVARTDHTLAIARERGCADETTPDMAEAVHDADLVVVATPVGSVSGALERIAEHVRPSALVTDVASTKATICEAADRLLTGRARFVGGHPMAGDDQVGVANARDHLFEGCVWALTPTAATSGEAVERLTEFAGCLGARIVELDPAAHDRLVAATSHLPHVVAAALVNAVWTVTDGHPSASALTASGFRDTTRVAGAPADLWDDIVLDNAQAILPTLEAALAQLSALRGAVAARDESAIHAFLDQARERRSLLLRKESS